MALGKSYGVPPNLTDKEPGVQGVEAMRFDPNLPDHMRSLPVKPPRKPARTFDARIKGGSR